jgi:hypothetical protein
VQLDEFFWQVESDERLRGVDLRKGDSPEADLVVVEDLKTGFIDVCIPKEMKLGCRYSYE